MTILAASIPMTESHPLSMLPFLLLLLCIAALPIVLKHHWERHYHLVALFLAASIPMTESHPLSMLPFLLLLLCIAALLIVLKHHWERHYHLVALFLAAITTAYYLFAIRQPQPVLRECADYIRFMALVGSLFIVAGGIHVRIRGKATPSFNCAFLFLATITGNILGTTGASMLFIRAWIRTNKYRYTGLHTAFFIFLVSNLGGGLTPMGPPPRL